MSLQPISKYRTELMGIATICILLCHSVAYIKFPPIIESFLNLGNFGVDIFLFLSGLGLYYSLLKRRDSEKSLSSWYKHRFTRIGVPYLLITGVMQMLFVVLKDKSILDAILSITTIGYWLNHSSAWFIALLIPLYSIAPTVFIMQDNKYGSYIIVSLIVGLYLYGLVDIPHDNDSLAYNVQSAISRSTGFLYGFIVGKMLYYNKGCKVITLLVVIMLFILARFASGNFELWILLLPTLIVLAALLSKCKHMRNTLTVMGIISLESYLTNGNLGYLSMHHPFLFDSTGWNNNNYFLYSCVIVVGLLTAYAVNLLSKRIGNSISH